MSMTPEKKGGEASGDAGRDIIEGSDEAARLPSLEEQTPGLDRAQEARTLRDAEAFYGKQRDQGDAQENNDAPMSGQDMKESGKQRP